MRDATHSVVCDDWCMVEVRRANPHDSEAAAVTFIESRVSAGSAIPPSVHTEVEIHWFVREVLIGEHETWIAVDGGRVLGLLTLRGDFIDQLYVASTAQGRGVGSRLVEVAKRERPAGLQLWTFQSNRPAREFYLKHGFVEAERTDGSANEERSPDIRYKWAP